MVHTHSSFPFLGLLAAFLLVGAIPKPQETVPDPDVAKEPGELAQRAQPNVVAQGTEGSLEDTGSDEEPAVIEAVEIKLSGSRLHFLASGPSRAPTVLLLHGARFSAQTWQELGTLELLARQGYRALALDLPGYGKSEASDIARDRLLGSLLPLISNSPVVVVSPSMSGAFSFPLLTQRPSLVAGFVPVAPAAIATHLGSLQGSRMPTLIFWGDQDQVISLKQGELLNRALANSRLVVLEDAKHPCYLDRPFDFHRELLQFLKSLKL